MLTVLPETCSADTGLAKWQFNTDFTSGSSAFAKWNTTAGTVESTSLGAKFSIEEQGDAPTIASDFYIFFGRVDVKMRAANGTGIISTYILESDDLDEIDWVIKQPSPKLRDTSNFPTGTNQQLYFFHPNRLFWQGQYIHLRPRHYSQRDHPGRDFPHLLRRLDLQPHRVASRRRGRSHPRIRRCRQRQELPPDPGAHQDWYLGRW